MPAVTPSVEGTVKRRKRARPSEDKASTAQGDSEVASSTVLLSMSQTALLLFLVAFVVVSLTKLSALEEKLATLKITLKKEVTQLKISSKSGICRLLRLK